MDSSRECHMCGRTQRRWIVEESVRCALEDSVGWILDESVRCALKRSVCGYLQRMLGVW